MDSRWTGGVKSTAATTTQNAVFIGFCFSAHTGVHQRIAVPVSISVPRQPEAMNNRRVVFKTIIIKSQRVESSVNFSAVNHEKRADHANYIGGCIIRERAFNDIAEEHTRMMNFSGPTIK